MGWREHDWARFTDEEWGRMVGRSVATPVPPRTLSAATTRPPRTTSAGLLAGLVTLLASALGLLLHFGTTLRVPSHRPPPANVVDVHWRASDLAPAATAGRICVTVPPTARVCAGYDAGERPADALGEQLRARGISTRSS